MVHGVGIQDARGAARLGDGELLPEPVGQSRDDLVLHVEQLGDRLVETLAPDVASRPGVDELDAHPHSRAAALDAALEQAADVEVPADLLHVDSFAPVGERGVAGDDKSPGNAGEVARQALCDPVHEGILLGAAAEVQERQHDDGEPGRRLRGRRRRLWRPPAVYGEGEDPDRLGDVLEQDRAEVLGDEVDPPSHLTPRVLRETDSAGRGDAFETPQDSQSRERAFLVDAGETRIADDVADEDRGQLADFGHRGSVAKA